MESHDFTYRDPLKEIFEPDFLSSVNAQIPEDFPRDAYFRADYGHPINPMLHLDI